MEKFILALDAGTTSSRAILFDKNGIQISISQFEFTQIFPKESWVEHDPIEILNTQLKAIHDVINKSNISVDEIDSIGITNQRETTVVWNKHTGKPVYNAIVWQDRRTATFCDELDHLGKANTFYNKTGLLLDAYFSENLTISDWNVLTDIVSSIGVDPNQFRSVVNESREDFAKAVVDEHNEAINQGITAVPTVLINEVLPVPGAQETETYINWIERIIERSKDS